MKNKIFIGLIIGLMFLGGYWRLREIDKVPSHLGNDEISIGYDTYSLRMTGKDEYGISWPLSYMFFVVLLKVMYFSTTGSEIMS